MYVCIHVYISACLPARLPARARGRGPASAISHRLPDGVRTNDFFAEVPQYAIIMP